MTTLKVHKKNPKFQFSSIIRKTKSMTYPFYSVFRKLSKFFNFSEGMARSYSVELKLYWKRHFMNFKKIPLNNFLPKASIWIGQLVLHGCKKSGGVAEQNFEIKKQVRASFMSGLRVFTRHLTSGILRARRINRNLDSLSWRVRSCYVVCRLRARAAKNPFEPP